MVKGYMSKTVGVSRFARLAVCAVGGWRVCAFGGWRVCAVGGWRVCAVGGLRGWQFARLAV